MRIVYVIGLLLISASAEARDIKGVPSRIADGDTMIVDGVDIRMFGYDAPETGYFKDGKYIKRSQLCVNGNKCYPCGSDAKAALIALAAKKEVVCKPTGSITHGRTTAVCFQAGRNINLEMVKRGWGLPYWRYFRNQDEMAAYGQALSYAISKNRGILRGAFILPQNWRNAEQRLACEKPY